MNTVNRIKSFLDQSGIPYQTDVDLRDKTWIKRGGIASIWVQPDRISDLSILAQWCAKNQIQFEIVGNTSNIYFRNSCNPTLVVSILKLNKSEFRHGRVRCEAGCNLAQIARKCVNKGISGYEGFSGIPGTVAGATINNSGCYGSVIENVLDSVIAIENGKIVRLRKSDFAYTNRNSVFKNGHRKIIILYVYLKTTLLGDRTSLQRLYEQHKIQRQSDQEPKRQNLGSTFCDIDYAKLRGSRSFLFRLLYLFCRPFCDTARSKNRCFAKLTIWLYGGIPIKKYISEFGVHCFVWRDSLADTEFPEYVAFINKAFDGHQKLEIEVKE